jgi:hypothetical protein
MADLTRGAAVVQPALTGLEEIATLGHARPLAEDRAERRRADRLERLAAPDRRARRRYWSVRDLSRRLWLGRGYELLRELIRAGILPATRSARSWWVDDADAAGLMAAFDDRAGKVRAFRGLDAWLRERCFVTELTPEAEAVLRVTRSGLAWRGRAYLPEKSWRLETTPDGSAEYRHVSGLTVS